MLNENDTREVIGATAYGSDGEKIGKVGQLFLDDQTGRPEFVSVNTGFFGTSESLVPVRDAELSGADLRLAHTKDKVKEAPHVDIDAGHMTEADEQTLQAYYGLGGGSHEGDLGEAGRRDHDHRSADLTAEAAGTDGGAVGRDVSGPETDDAMTRSEEHLRVGTTDQESGRARLRKYVTTEMETQTVPVRKEHAVLETEPITDANAGDAIGGPAISEEEHEVVLHEERAVTETVVEPVERVRLTTETTVEDETVEAEVRKEHIEADGDVDHR